MDFETALREACIEADKTYWKSFFERMDSLPDILIPKDKDKRLRDFILNYELKSADKKNRKGMTRGIKALLIAAIILLAAAFTAFAFEPVRNFVYTVYTDGTEFIFESSRGNKNDYLYADFSYIPDGYKLVSNTKTKTEHRIVYMNGGNMLTINSYESSGSVLGIDTENAVHGELEINGCVGYYSINQSSLIIVWSTGKYFHIIIADQCDEIGYEDVVQIAQSITPAF